MTKKQEKAVEKLLIDFDFELVRNAMLLKEWKWFCLNRTPTINELKDEVRELFSDLFKNTDYHSISSGGLSAEREYDNNECVGIKLTFTLITEYLEV